MKTKCLIVDDEPLAINLIASHIEKVDNLEIAGSCKNAMEAMSALRDKKVDLLFLDIQMPEITGLDFLKTLKNPPKIIITTAYRQYALEGFELDVVDYLLKPISFERFIKAVNKYYERADSSIKIIGEESLQEKSKDTYIYIKERKKVLKIYLKDIIYIEGLGEYIRIHTKDKPVITKNNLKVFEEKLPSNFIRIHKSFIVSVEYIKAFTANSIETSEKELPIGRSYKKAVLKALNYYSDLI